MNTKACRRLSVLAASAALVYAAASAWAFYRFQRLVQTLKYYGISEAQQLELENVSQWRRSLTYEGVVFFVFAAAAAAVAFGLFRARGRARVAWYILMVCFAAYHLFRLITDYRLGVFILTVRVVEVLSTFLLAGVTIAVVFNRPTRYDAPPPPPTEWGGS